MLGFREFENMNDDARLPLFSRLNICDPILQLSPEEGKNNIDKYKNVSFLKYE